MWRIIDNRKEKIFEEKFDTQEKAEEIMKKFIAISILKKSCYDYDVQYFDDDNMIYNDYYEKYYEE